ENLPGSYDGTFSLVFTRSGDRGRSWAPGRVVDAEIVPTGRFLVYLPVTPGFAIASNGDLYAVWADGRAGDPDILLSRSTNDGKTWSKPVQVNRGTAGDGVPQDMPAVGVAPGGRVDVVYYDRTIDRRGSKADVLLSSSPNSGRTFPKVFRLSDADSNRKIGPEGSPHAQEADFGSRTAVASLAGGVIAAWTDTRNGSLDGGKQDIFTTQVPLDDNASLPVTNILLGGGGVLLGGAGVTLFLLSRRGRKKAPAAEEPLDTH
ncbi:MAG TPA: sialidase family protein, partial [Acidimicrobiales bacterium]|nr:sialidase family protein [Acidimicrobiales bacterium]